MNLATDLLISDFEAQPSVDIGIQITRHIRELILSGRLSPDTRIPSTRTLADRWHVQGRTVQAALAPLVREGLLIRTPRRGSFVRSRPKKLACVGIYEHVNADSLPEAAFLRILNKLLIGRLAKSGIETIHWADTRLKEASARSAMPRLLDACQRGEIQGLIFPVTTKHHFEWQRKLPVAMSFSSSEPVFNAVTYDESAFFELGARELARVGCRSIGLISSLVTETTPAQGLPHMNAQAYERFFDVVGELKLRVREPWVHASRVHNPLSMERFGYERFKALWGAEIKPEGLIVNDDVIARGVITAMLELGVHAPRDLRLVLHRNKEIDLLCPFPAAFIESSAKDEAKALIEQVEKQFRGEACERILLPWILIKD